jgi:hypothetical protein
MFGFDLGVLQGKMLELEYAEAVPPMKQEDFSQKKMKQEDPDNHNEWVSTVDSI